MKLHVLYFASLREALGRAEEWLELDGIARIDELRSHLAARGAPWDRLNAASVRCARNQTMCDGQAPIADGDEIAFFPPVTGG